MIVDNAAGEDPDFSEFMMNSIIVHPDYAKQNAETVRKITRALVRANRWGADNPAEAARERQGGHTIIDDGDARFVDPGIHQAPFYEFRDRDVVARARILYPREQAALHRERNPP